MPGWVKVAEKEKDTERELQLEDDGTLLLENVRNVFNDATTLEYKNPENNARRVVKCVNEVLHPPDESGWGDHVYIPVTSVKSSQGLKRKISKASSNEDEHEQELDNLLGSFFDGEEVKQEPKIEEQIKTVDNRQEDNNNNNKSRSKEMEMENRRSSCIKNKGQNFVVKNIIKCEENESIKMCLKRAQMKQSVLLEKCSAMNLKKAQKRKSMLLEECSACKKFLTHNYMKDHVRRCPMMKAKLN